jgi:hypothetical protein
LEKKASRTAKSCGRTKKKEAKSLLGRENSGERGCTFSGERKSDLGGSGCLEFMKQYYKGGMS